MPANTPNTVTLWIDGQPVQGIAGRSLLNAIINAGLLVQTACGGMGVCHLCRVWIDAPPPAAPPTPVEVRAIAAAYLAEGVRLSCQVPVIAGLRVRLVPFDAPQAQRPPRRKGSSA